MDIKNGLYREWTDRHREWTDKRIVELISASEGFGYTLMMLDQYAKEAKQALDVFKDSVAKKKLYELADTVQQSAHRFVSDYLF